MKRERGHVECAAATEHQTPREDTTLGERNAEVEREEAKISHGRPQSRHTERETERVNNESLGCMYRFDGHAQAQSVCVG